MTLLAHPRNDWLQLDRTDRPVDRTCPGRAAVAALTDRRMFPGEKPRRLLNTRALSERRHGPSGRSAVAARALWDELPPGLGRVRHPDERLTAIEPGLGRARHPDERAQFRKLLLADPEAPLTLITRPRSGCLWGAFGSALRVCNDLHVDKSCPPVLNESRDCFDLGTVFPDFCAVGARSLQPGFPNRFVFEVRKNAAARRHILQVGIARLDKSGKLEEGGQLAASVLCSSVGDVVSSVGPIEILGGGMRMRDGGDWCSDGPTWLIGPRSFTTRVMLEADLGTGTLAISVGEWASEPAMVSVPGLLSEEDDRPWFPIVSLTAVGLEARILDLHVRADV